MCGDFAAMFSGISAVGRTAVADTGYTLISKGAKIIYRDQD